MEKNEERKTSDAKKKEGDRFWSLNYEMLPYKMHFFLYFGAMSAVLTFGTVFAKSKFHLQNSQVASLYATQQLIVIVTKPAIGAIVDYFNKMKLVIIILTVLQVTFSLLLLAVPGFQGKSELKLDKGINNSVKFLNYDGPEISNDSHTCTLLNNFLAESQSLVDEEKETGANISTNNSSNCMMRHNDATFCIKRNELAVCSNICNLLACSFELNEEFGETGKSNLLVSLKCLLLHSFMNKLSRFSINSSTNNEYELFATLFYNNSECITDDLGSDSYSVLRSWSNTSGLKQSRTENLNSSMNLLVDKCFKTSSIIQHFGECSIVRNMAAIIEEYKSVHYDLRIKSDSEKSPYATHQFWVFAILLLSSGICSNALFTLSDTACYESLQKTNSDYGRQRVWGAVSWGLFAPLAGYLNDLATEKYGVTTYAPGFYLSAVLAAIQILNISRLDLVKPYMSDNILKDVRTLFKSYEFVIFISGVFVTGLFTSVIWFYLMIFLEGIGSSKFLLGLVHSSQCFLGEAPFMFFSGWILRKCGYLNALILTFLCFSLRFICYYFLEDPWFVLPVEVTHGLSYGVFYTAMTAYGKYSAPPGTEATTQSVLCCAYEGLGSGLGCVITGICFDRLGSRNTFLLGSGCGILVTILHIIATSILKLRQRTMKLERNIVA